MTVNCFSGDDKIVWNISSKVLVGGVLGDCAFSSEMCSWFGSAARRTYLPHRRSVSRSGSGKKVHLDKIIILLIVTRN